MVPGRFSGIRRSWWPPFRARGDHETVPRAPVLTTAAQTSNISYADIPAQGSLPNSTRIPVPGDRTTSSQFASASAGDIATALHSSQGDVPVPVPMGEVPMESTLSWPVCLNSVHAKEHVDRIRQFRILVMGRANAGKTTILQRVCNTTDQPDVFIGGQKVDLSVVQGSIRRGHHNIKDELVFRSNPKFVFHDSCGFEAGSEEQFKMMKEFVMNHARTPILEERIHVIWFCIPLSDSHRMVTTAETKFFDECDTGDVPVIVLLTKADTLMLEAVEQLEDQGLSVDDGTRVAALEKDILNNHITNLKNWLNKLKFAPYDYLSLARMHVNGAECTSLIKCTTNALSAEGLQALLISTQQTNLALCIEFAILKTLKECMTRMDSRMEPAVLAFMLSRWFPYKYQHVIQQRAYQFYGFRQGYRQNEYEFRGLQFEQQEERQAGREAQHGQSFEDPEEADTLLEPELPEMDNMLVPVIHQDDESITMPTFATPTESSMKHVAKHGIGTLLVFEYLYFLLQGGSCGLQENLTSAVEYYKSHIQANVHRGVEEAFEKHGEDVEKLCPIFVGIAKENQMSKKLK